MPCVSKNTGWVYIRTNLGHHTPDPLSLREGLASKTMVYNAATPRKEERVGVASLEYLVGAPAPSILDARAHAPYWREGDRKFSN